MSKQITPSELASLITILLTAPQDAGELDTPQKFSAFMTDIAKVMCEHCGGEIQEPADCWAGHWLIAVHGNDSIPESGGVWRNYDPEGDLFDLSPSSEPSVMEPQDG
jgi:hypothetical protein